FLLRECRYRTLGLAAVVVSVELDPVRTVASLITHRIQHLLTSADRDAALRQIHVGAEAHRTRTVTVAGDGCAGGDEHVRAGDHPLVDRALRVDVGVAGTLGAEVTQRGEAGHQRVVHMPHRFYRAIRL